MKYITGIWDELSIRKTFTLLKKRNIRSVFYSSLQTPRREGVAIKKKNYVR
jgi:hypothetical protein